MKKLNTLLDQTHVEEDFGPDPVILRKKGLGATAKKKFTYYKQKVDDPGYMEFAINKIAMELSHFLSK